MAINIFSCFINPEISKNFAPPPQMNMDQAIHWHGEYWSYPIEGYLLKSLHVDRKGTCGANTQ